MTAQNENLIRRFPIFGEIVESAADKRYARELRDKTKLISELQISDLAAEGRAAGQRITLANARARGLRIPQLFPTKV